MTEPWSTEKIREAFIYDGGEAAYYDPISGASEQRRIAGGIFDAWLSVYTAEKQAEALEQAAAQIRHKQHPLSIHQMLITRAQRLREQATNQQNRSQ